MYILKMERFIDTISVKHTSTSVITNTLLIKLDDDIKVITDNFIPVNKLKDIMKTYYPTHNCEIYSFSNNIKILIQSLVDDTSFLKDNNISSMEFIKKIELVDNLMKSININLKSLKHDILPQIVSDDNIADDHLKDYTIPYANIINISPYEMIDESMDLGGFNTSLLNNLLNYNIYFNSQFNNIVMINTDDDLIFRSSKLKLVFPELILIISKKLDFEIVSQINELNSDICINVEDATAKINKILNNKIINSKLSIKEIILLINTHYEIDTKLNNPIKFSDILSIVLSEFKITDSYVNYIKRLLPIILTDLKLKKICQADGTYWAGLIEKCKIVKTVKSNDISDMPVNAKDFDNFINTRTCELKEIENNLFFNKTVQETFQSIDQETATIQICSALKKYQDYKKIVYESIELLNKDNQTI